MNRSVLWELNNWLNMQSNVCLYYCVVLCVSSELIFAGWDVFFVSCWKSPNTHVVYSVLLSFSVISHYLPLKPFFLFIINFCVQPDLSVFPSTLLHPLAPFFLPSVLCVFDLVLQIKLPVSVDERHIGFFLYLQQTLYCLVSGPFLIYTCK